MASPSSDRAGRTANSSTLDRQSAARPLAPGARVQLGLHTRALEGEDGHGGGDAGAAVHSDLRIRVDHRRLGRIRHVHGARNMAGDLVDRLFVAAVALGRTRVDEDEPRLPEALLDLLGRDYVVFARLGAEIGCLDALLAGT